MWVGIEHRLVIADSKTEMGRWESDTVIGANHTGVIVTHVDKASKFLLAGLAKNKTVQQINQVTINLFEKIGEGFRKTMTFDNGKEFSGHQQLAEDIGLLYFFAKPYHSWERGLNEHTHGLLRQFFPKGTNFKIVKAELLQHVVDLINYRLRKCLDYRMPYEVLYSQPSALIALRSCHLTQNKALKQSIYIEYGLCKGFSSFLHHRAGAELTIPYQRIGD